MNPAEPFAACVTFWSMFAGLPLAALTAALCVAEAAGAEAVIVVGRSVFHSFTSGVYELIGIAAARR